MAAVQWVARIDEQRTCYGPFADQEHAQRYADFLTAEVDPAVVERLVAPIDDCDPWYDVAVRRATPMSGPQHFTEGERLLSEASFVRSPEDPQPVGRHGGELYPAVHAALLGRAMAHFAAAHAAAVMAQGEGDR